MCVNHSSSQTQPLSTSLALCSFHAVSIVLIELWQADDSSVNSTHGGSILHGTLSFKVTLSMGSLKLHTFISVTMFLAMTYHVGFPFWVLCQPNMDITGLSFAKRGSWRLAGLWCDGGDHMLGGAVELVGCCCHALGDHHGLGWVALSPDKWISLLFSPRWL